MPRRIFFLVFSAAFWLYALAGQAIASTYAENGDTIGAIMRYTVRKNDTLYEIARRFDIGIVELLSANPGVDPWMPAPGTELTITSMHILPDATRQGIVLNLPELRLFYFAGDHQVMTFPIGIGREGWQTPTGSTTVVLKRKDPAWIPPESIREENPDLPDIVPPGPDNPLGQYALNLGMPGERIHGTNRPYGVGKRSSHGCIRLYPEDIEQLFNAVSVGTPVTIVDMPYKLGWRNDTLFLEVTPTQQQADEIARYKRPAPLSIPGIHDAIRKAAGDDLNIDWEAADRAIAERSGIPVAIAARRKR